MPDDAPSFRIVEAAAWLDDCIARLPFRFGIVTMRGAPLCIVRTVIECTDGRRQEGWASDLLVPKWFEKDPDRTLAQSWQVLIDDIAEACRLAPSNARETAFNHWRRLYHTRVNDWNGDRSWRLVQAHGVSLIERAVLDALCRIVQLPLHTVIRDGLAGFDDAMFGIPTAAHQDAVLEHPTNTMIVRHTIGLLDPLDDSDTPIPTVKDRHPVTLAQAINAHGLSHFKIKVSGDLDADLQRLQRIARVIASCDRPVVTLDGNEQYGSIDQLALLLARMRGNSDTARLADSIISIEQPLPRARTFETAANAGLKALCDRIPVIIDEADVDVEALPDAAALGYRGVSVKNCKGVFRAIANAARCRLSNGRMFQSSEDLTNIPILALHQDLVTAAMLGLSHSERNGHHYFDGLRHLPASEVAAATECHPDLYAADPARLMIHDGRVMIASLHETNGYGYDGPIDLSSRTPLAEWSPDSLLTHIEET